MISLSHIAQLLLVDIFLFSNVKYSLEIIYSGRGSISKPDRAVTRDLPNGIPVPIDGFRDKKIYVWFEAVAGYYTASVDWAQKLQNNITDFWNNRTKSYYVHGKDNIPFHTIIWPAILSGLEIEPLPEYIISSEYLTLENKKI
ncbi:methionyl-tRNA synthetase [Streptococcus pneumoniae]|nr:methionyl-tRNA synthetase [Streptococcus pneumoniae]